MFDLISIILLLFLAGTLIIIVGNEKIINYSWIFYIIAYVLLLYITVDNELNSFLVCIGISLNILGFWSSIFGWKGGKK